MCFCASPIHCYTQMSQCICLTKMRNVAHSVCMLSNAHTDNALYCFDWAVLSAKRKTQHQNRECILYARGLHFSQSHKLRWTHCQCTTFNALHSMHTNALVVFVSFALWLRIRVPFYWAFSYLRIACMCPCSRIYRIAGALSLTRGDRKCECKHTSRLLVNWQTLVSYEATPVPTKYKWRHLFYRLRCICISLKWKIAVATSFIRKMLSLDEQMN